jgi:transposase InsO family protein
MKDGNWVYLSCWMDLFSRVIVGWLVLDHMREELVISSLERAIQSRRPPKGLIIHSDGGGQYGSSNFRKLIAGQEFEQSMTRRDNHYDNAFAESFFSRLKAEKIRRRKFDNLEEARSCCFEYIDMYYNTQRKHSSIGYKKPLQFERELEG